MAVLRLEFSRTEEEWNNLICAIDKKSSGRDVSAQGKSISRFLSTSINRAFKDIDVSNHPDAKVGTILKGFKITVSEEIHNKVLAECKKRSISPSTLLARIIIDPTLLI